MTKAIEVNKVNAPRSLETVSPTMASVMESISGEVRKSDETGEHVKAYALSGAGQGGTVEFLKAETIEAFGRAWELSAPTYVARLGGKETALGKALYDQLKNAKCRILNYIVADLVAKGHAASDMPEALKVRAVKAAAKAAKGAKEATRSPEEITLEELKAAYDRLAKRIDADTDGKHPALEKAKAGLVVSLRALGWNVAV